MLKHDAPRPLRPGRGLDAAIDEAFSDDPLVWKVRELIKATVFESEVRKDPHHHAGDPRAATILARLELEKVRAKVHARELAFATGGGTEEN